MKPGDLTTLQHVKEWLGITNSDSDVLLRRLITSASKFVLNYLNRPNLAVTAFADTYDTYGKNWLQLRQWPVVGVQSILFAGNTLTTPASGNPLTNGFWVGNTGGSTEEPAGGQQSLTVFGYSVDEDGLYTFNVAQAGAGVLITYSYVLPDIEQAVWELVGERYKTQDRIGIQSKSLGGQETISYFQGAMSSYVVELLQNYRRVVPG